LRRVGYSYVRVWLIFTMLRFVVRCIMMYFWIDLLFAVACFPFELICCSLYRNFLLNRFVVHCLVMYFWIILLFAISWCSLGEPICCSLFRDVFLNRFVVRLICCSLYRAFILFAVLPHTISLYYTIFLYNFILF